MIIASMLAKEGREKKKIMESLLSLLRPQINQNKETEQAGTRLYEYSYHFHSLRTNIYIYIRHKLFHSYSGLCKDGAMTWNQGAKVYN